MSVHDMVLACLVLSVGIFLARRAGHVARVLLFGTALVISGLLFLPGSQVAGVFGGDVLRAMHRLARETPLRLSDWVHLVAFFGLGLVVWLGRPDLRGWRAWAVVAVLAAAAEVAQVLAPGRTPRIGDVVFNLVGAATGLLLGWVLARMFGRSSRD